MVAIENKFPVKPPETKTNQEQKTSLDKTHNTEDKTLTDLLRVEKSAINVDSVVINSIISKLSPESILRLPLWQKMAFLDLYGNVLSEKNKKLIQNNMLMVTENQATEAVASGALNSMTSISDGILEGTFNTAKETIAAMGRQVDVTNIPEQATSNEKLERGRMVSTVGGIENNVTGLRKEIFDEAPKNARAKIARGIKETKR